MPQKASKSQAKTQNGKKYLEYSEMSKEDLIAMLRRVHARIKRISASLREMENEIESLRQLLLYGSAQASSSSSSSTGYTKGRAYKGRTYRRTGKKQAGVEEEPIEEEEEVGVVEEEEEEEEEPKPAEKKSGEAKAETKPEKGGS
jgi:hypothetical protein